jgi:hypothetical protein
MACAYRNSQWDTSPEIARSRILRSFWAFAGSGSSTPPAMWPGDILSVCKRSATHALPGDVIKDGT